MTREQNDGGLKQLIRFDLKGAEKKARMIIQQYSNKILPINLADMLKEAELFKWAVKVLADMPYLTILAKEGTEILKKLLSRVDELVLHEEPNELLHAQAKGTLLFAKVKIQQIFDTANFMETIEELQALKDKHPDDLILARLLVKSFQSLRMHDRDQLLLSIQQIKQINARMVAENKALIEKHEYTKLDPFVDMMTISLMKDVLTQQEFNRLTNKYLMDEDAAVQIQIAIRGLITTRLAEFGALEGQQRQLSRIGELLDDGKYANVQHGHSLYLDLAKRRLSVANTLKDKEGVESALKDMKQIIDTLDIPCMTMAYYSQLHFVD